MNVLLSQPVAALQQDTRSSETLPTGAVVEFPDDLGSFFLEVDCKGHRYSVLRDDLMVACTWEDAERIGLVQTSNRVKTRA
jgi:hypothetical protein